MLLDLTDPLQEFDLVDWFIDAFTHAPYMGELLFLSLIFATIGIVMYIQTGGVAVPFVLTMVFAGIIGAAVGGTVANFIAVAMVIVIPAVVVWMLWTTDR